MRIRTSCNRDCPDACGIIATVENGRVIKIQGDPEHPVTRGFLCYRTSRFLERQYDPERLTTPMMRRGEGFEPVDWDRALDRIAETLLRVREESGPEAILNYRSGGSLGLSKHIIDFFFEKFGPVTIKSGDICSGAGDFAQEEDFGVEDSHDLFDLLQSRTIVIWGKNPYVSNVHLLPVLQQARDAGARLIQIDPTYHRGARLGQLYIQPRPGGDMALALGVAREMFDRKQHDARAADYCDHYEEFRANCLQRTSTEWAAMAGVPSEQLEELAGLYADGPSAILVGWGMQRRSNGAATVRVLDALGAISGNLGVPGGGVSFYFKRRGAFDLSFTQGLKIAPRSIPEPLLGPGILAAQDPPVRVVWVSNGNPVAMLPESDTVDRALRTRDLTVVVDSFLTDTAMAADLVLPTTTMLEDEDLVGAYGHHYLGEVRAVVAPPEGVRTDYEILQALAGRVGLGAEFEDDIEGWKRKLLARVAPRGASLEALRQGAVRNPESPRVLFEGRKFPTASGKVNLIHELDPEPARPTAKRPLFLMALANKKTQAAQSPSRLQQGPPHVVVHPDAAPGFRSGDPVMVESALGSLQARLQFDERQRYDVALMDKGGWRHRGRCANALVTARVTDAGGGAVLYETPVRLLPV